MAKSEKAKLFRSAREKFLGLSLESTRKSYYPQLQAHLEVLKKNERQLQLLIDNLPARISYVDSRQHYILVNREYEKVFHTSRDQIVGKQVKTKLGDDNYAKVESYMQKALKGEHVRFETVFTGQNGEQHWLEINYVPDIDPQAGITGFYDLTHDRSEQKRNEHEKLKLETRLQQAQKMEAIGTLAGGVAHDFNNLLMGIQGRVSLMILDMGSDHPHYEHLKSIEKYIHSATDLTKQLLGFARGGKYEVKPMNINKLIQTSSKMFGRTKKEIRIYTRLDEESWTVKADSRQIEQVLLNLYVNAWQAMPSGGTLFLETQNVWLEEKDAFAQQVKPGGYVKVSVTDTGSGMDELTRQRIFDPFFTTKKKGRGTGLGLASAYGIIKNHGGFITVYSEIDQGTTINFYLPVSEKKEVRESVSDNALQKGMEKILLVDDEDVIIEVGIALLEKLGYKVICARSGKEAVDIISKRGKEIDLVILDMIMPHMDGGKAFDRIREISPEMPVLLSSGYSINGQAERIMQRGCNGFIQKPFNINELSGKIREILK